MTWDFTELSAMYILTFSVTFFASLLNWNRRKQPGILYLTVMLAFLSLWSLFRFVEYSVIEVSAKFFFFKLGILCAEIFVTALNFFILDFFHMLQWFTGKKRWVLWGLILALNVLDWTNASHHLCWIGYSYSATLPNVVIFQRGPLAFLKLIYILTIVSASHILLIHSIVMQKGWERMKAIILFLAILFPFVIYILSIYFTGSYLMSYLAPYGFVVTGLTISWIVYEDLEKLISTEKVKLEETIETLQDEIQTRQKLEIDLRQSQDELAVKLASQSNKLAGMYELILYGSEPMTYQMLLEKSLEKIKEVMECRSVVYYLPEDDHFNLDCSISLDDERHALLQKLYGKDLLANNDIRADLDIKNILEFSEIARKSGFESALSKWVNVEDTPVGALVALWERPVKFSVEEIILFGALTDGLGLILENSRLREKTFESATRMERERLARDLHDSVTQSLHSLTLSAQTARSQIDGDPEKLKKTLTHLEISSRQALKEMRLLLYELRPYSGGERNLVDALRNRLESVEQRAGIQTSLIVNEKTTWQKKWETELYPLANEALNNSLKHGYASHVWVILSGNKSDFSMEIRDDGIGFIPETISSYGMGLRNMRERCEKLGAQLEILSAPHAGTTIKVTLSALMEKR